MAIKLNLNKLEIDMSFKSLFKELDKNGFSLLPVTFYHTNKLISLELHHRDPFDRIIICQALVDKLTIIGKDAYFKNYKVNQVW